MRYERRRIFKESQMHIGQGSMETIQRTENVLSPTIWGDTTVVPQKNKRKTKGTTNERCALSKLSFAPIQAQGFQFGLDENENRRLASLFVETAKALIPEVVDWKFSSEQSLEDLMLKCLYELKEKAKVDHIETLYDQNNFKLILKRFVCSRSTVHCIPLQQIFKLRNKHRGLFHILMCFVKSLPFTGLFDSIDGRIDWLWDYLYEDYSYKQSKKEKIYASHSFNFFHKHEKWYKAYNTEDWEQLVKHYTPRKPLHKQLKKLLLDANGIDFHAPFKICIKDEEDSFFEHHECFLLIDEIDSEFTSNYIQMLNECSHEHDIQTAYQFAIAEKGNIEPFDPSIPSRLSELDAFLSDFNDLLNKL